LKFVGGLLRQVFAAGPLAKIGYLFARGALGRLKEILDPRRYNGAVLLGLNGVVVKSHGGTDAQGFAHAVDVALDMIANDFNSRIADGLAAMDSALLSAAESASAPNA
jgi:glycerol-3-phosphate acyltransferase PlsX